jgi:hypothetical protein
MARARKKVADDVEVGTSWRADMAVGIYIRASFRGCSVVHGGVQIKRNNDWIVAGYEVVVVEVV